MPNQYTWHSILGIVREHRKDLISAHIVAILAAVASVPIPLLMPLLVDEVL
ncbi:MAG: V-type synthase subunit, partial [Proteobacteria bacterium]|nr:V-type synthase subunit [Pseudomonadota bacterium]